jgi:hypothetical protein
MKSWLLASLLWTTIASGQAASADEKPAEVPKAEQSTKSLQRMRGALRDVLGKLEEARKAKDVIKLNCVNEKLTQIKGLVRISEQADSSLQEALAKEEATTTEHELTKINIASQKVDQLRGEVEQCIGELAFRTDESLLLEVDTPEELPSQDPTRPGNPPGVVVRVPPDVVVTLPPDIVVLPPDPIVELPPASPTL